MEVKGTTVIACPLYVKDHFRQEGYQKWLDAMSPASRNIYSTNILTSSWYPVQEALVEPHQVIVDLFHNGDVSALRELGAFSANYSLKGVYKIFIKFGSPGWIIDRGRKIFETFYRPGVGEMVAKEKDHAAFQVTGFPERTGLVEIRVAGWIQRALELSGTKDPTCEISKSLSKGDSVIEFIARWKP